MLIITHGPHTTGLHNSAIPYYGNPLYFGDTIERTDLKIKISIQPDILNKPDIMKFLKDMGFGIATQLNL